jgi:ABC-type nitrate/sulfonate/bicarbonate transport system substrate-binding protein
MYEPTRARFLGGSLALTLAATAPALAQSGLAKVRIGVTPTEVYAEAYYAADEGFFIKGGLDADVETLNSGSAAANAIIGGALDVGVTTPILLANAILHQAPFVLIAAGPLSTTKAPQSLICVKASSNYHTAKDLEGKTVGMIVLKTTQELSLDAWLDKNGAQRSSVRRVEVLFSEMETALDRGTIDAAIISEPFLTTSLKSGTVRSLGDPNVAIAPTYLLGAWFTTRAFAEANPATVKKFVDVIYATAKWANAHQPQTALIISKYMKIDPSITRVMNRIEYAESQRLPDMQALLDSGYKYGALPKPVVAADLFWHA